MAGAHPDPGPHAGGPAGSGVVSDPHGGANLLERRDGALLRYRGTIPRINPVVLADIAQAQTRLDRMARRVPLQAPWSAPHAGRRDGVTLATWLSRNVATRTARELLTVAVRAVWACEPDELSLLHALFYLHSGGGFDSLIGTSGGAQQDRVVGGTQLLATGLASRLGPRVLLGRPVRAIHSDADTVTVVAGDGEGWRAPGWSWRCRRRWPVNSTTTRCCRPPAPH